MNNITMADIDQKRMSHTRTRTRSLLREQVVKFRCDIFHVRVWRQVDDLEIRTNVLDNSDLVACAQRYVAEHPQNQFDPDSIELAKELSALPRVNAVEVATPYVQVQSGLEVDEVIYNDWP